LGKDPDASPEAERKVREKAEVLRKRMEQQVKSFNDRAKTDIVRTISDGIAADKSPNDIKNEIKLKYDKYKVKEAPQDYQIERVAKTEVINNVNLLKLIKWKEMGFEKAEQLVHIDERTCEVCKPLNHRIFDIDYLLENPDKRAALHPNCRCTYVAYS
jgi:SPP1 gp7 family putative phage head morphogenesis protein